MDLVNRYAKPLVFAFLLALCYFGRDAHAQLVTCRAGECPPEGAEAAPQAEDAVEPYIRQVLYHFHTCRDRYAMYLKEQQFIRQYGVKPIQRAMPNYKLTLDPSDCMEDAKYQLKPYFKKAHQTLDGAPGALEALKTSYAFWLTAIDSIYAGPGEIRMHYDQRQLANSQKLKDLVNKLRIENELRP